MSDQQTDQPERLEAVNPAHSFIVRAPAGAGKTQLLTLRFLALLSKVQKNPEEILALTFTRKAAAQMRERILTILTTASLPNQNLLDKQTFQLAQQVLERDNKEDWNLLDNPNRFNIQTIDAFCAHIVGKMPVFSSASQPKLVEDPIIYYRKAAHEALKEIDSNEAWSCAIEQLLNHLDNAHERIEALLIDRLSKRDQWLPYLMGLTDNDRPYLEEGLAQIVQEALNTVVLHFPPNLLHALMPLLHYATSQLNLEQPTHKTSHTTNLPTNQLSDYATWTTIARFLLTEENRWRKMVDKRNGFPAGKNLLAKKMKTAMSDLLNQLSAYPDLEQLLARFTFLPPLNYSDHQWNIIVAWSTVLKILTAHLNLIFQQEGVTDYIDIALKADKALGEESIPSDLALLLDRQIRHVLVDEFQDTSASQWRFLEKLTAAWQHGDGKTLFLVGDPMQSIYRFRKADVGLFLRAWKQGMHSVPLKPLILKMNFRSQAHLVHWVGNLFVDLMPCEENIAEGAIKFIASIPTKPAQPEFSATWHPLFNADSAKEAQTVIQLIQQLVEADPQGKISILVKSRTHIRAILPALRAANISYQATDIDPLNHRPIINDLLALTRAFLDPLDRVAWLAILRAPWCGLTLPSLYKIAGSEFEKTIWERILNVSEHDLAEEEHERLMHFKGVIQKNFDQKGIFSLRRTIEKIWHSLGGPICIEDLTDHQNTKIFFDLLDKTETAGDIPDVDYLENCLSKLYAHSLFLSDITSEPLVEIMTIHKAKGLEFDHVILPGLDRKPALDQAELLLLSEYVGPNQQNYLILGPIKDTENKFDPMYQYLKRQESEKARYESMRLLYVATTRAKKSLHLVGNVICDAENQIKTPAASSFLGQLWPQVESLFQKALSTHDANETETSETEKLFTSQSKPENHFLRRLKKAFIPHS